MVTKIFILFYFLNIFLFLIIFIFCYFIIFILFYFIFQIFYLYFLLFLFFIILFLLNLSIIFLFYFYYFLIIFLDIIIKKFLKVAASFQLILQNYVKHGFLVDYERLFCLAADFIPASIIGLVIKNFLDFFLIFF